MTFYLKWKKYNDVHLTFACQNGAHIVSSSGLYSQKKNTTEARSVAHCTKVRALGRVSHFD